MAPRVRRVAAKSDGDLSAPPPAAGREWLQEDATEFLTGPECASIWPKSERSPLRTVTMIHCRLLEMMGRKGIRFLSHLSEETGVNRRTLANLAENKIERFDAEVLERLCRYFECQPGDLLELKADATPGWMPSPFQS